MLAAGGGIRHADATGGTVSYSGDWQIHTFTSSGTFAFTSYSGTPPVKFVIVNGGNTGVNGADQTDNEDGAAGGAGAAGGLYRTSVGVYDASSFGLTNYSVVVGGAGSGSSFFGLGGITAGGTSGGGGAGGAYNGQGTAGSAGGSGPDLSTNFPWLTRLAGGGGGGAGADGTAEGTNSGGTGALGGSGIVIIAFQYTG